MARKGSPPRRVVTRDFVLDRKAMIAALSIGTFILLWTGFGVAGVLIWRTIRRLEDDDGPWYQGL